MISLTGVLFYNTALVSGDRGGYDVKVNERYRAISRWRGEAEREGGRERARDTGY